MPYGNGCVRAKIRAVMPWLINRCSQQLEGRGEELAPSVGIRMRIDDPCGDLEADHRDNRDSVSILSEAIRAETLVDHRCNVISLLQRVDAHVLGEGVSHHTFCL